MCFCSYADRLLWVLIDGRVYFQNRNRYLMQSLFQSKIFYFSCAVLCTVLFYQIVAMDMLLYLFVVMVVCTISFFGIKYPLFGLLFAFITMNSFFNLIPRQLFSGTFINKTWDLGFFFMIIFGGSLLIKKYKKAEYIPLYLKVFSVFLIICVISFIFTNIKYQFPMIDTFRSFRNYLGYLFIPFFLQYFLQAKDGEKALNKLLQSLYIISFVLLLIYNIQFLIQKQLFHGFNRIQITTYGASYLRSVPNFLFICYFFLWFNLSAWLLNKKLFPLGKCYMVLCFSAILFTFTRGIYISVFMILILIIFLILSSKRYNTTNIIIVSILGVSLFSTVYVAGFLQPFISRASTIGQATFQSERVGTLWYRIGLVDDRIRLINEENPFLGLGFVHNKYGYRFGAFRGNYDEETGGSALGCADIAWGNILYQTGWIGFSSFVLFIIFFMYYVFISLRKRISTSAVNTILLIELAAVAELLRMIIQTMNGNVFTGNTQNPALIFAIAGFAHILQKGIEQKNSENINSVIN